jgi:ABC-type uncharacterized transport system ATPase subunit
MDSEVRKLTGIIDDKQVQLDSEVKKLTGIIDKKSSEIAELTRRAVRLQAELDEIKSLADRIAVMFHGEIVAVVGVDEITKSELGLLMAGSSREA